MNWMDYVVIGIIIGYSFIGYARGFVYSVFKVASFFVAAFAALKFYPYVSNVLVSVFHLDEAIKDVISKNISAATSPAQLEQGLGSEAAGSLIGSWNLPQPVEAFVVENLSAQASQVAGNIAESLSGSLSTFAVNIISIVIIFAMVSFALIFVRSIMEGIARLPLFNQVNRAGGLAFGLLQGIIMIYIGFAILTLFAATPEMQGIFTAINSSIIAKAFYSNNLLLIWAFGGR